jgi:hypothetical protein
MPPLTVHSSTTWLSKLYDAAADTQKACFQVKMNGGKTKSVRVLIIRGNDLVADSGNATGVHKDWDAVTEAANPNLVSGGNTAGIFYDHYGPSGWTNTDAFKRFRAYQEERREYFKKNETHFRDNGIAIPQPFMHRQIACGEVFTNEGADHGGKGGFQALIHMLGPNTASDMPKLGSGYTNLGREIVRIGAHSVHVTGVSEALYCQDAVACAKFAINNTLNAVLTELENAPVGSVDTEPMYIVFGRYDSGQSCFASDDPSQWTGGNEAYVNNLRQWKVANSNSLVSD